MLEELQKMARIVEREKKARREAEYLLELKTRELMKKTSELEQSANKFKSVYTLLSEIMAVAPDMIITCFEDFTIHGGNTAAENNLEQQERDFCGRSIDDFLPGLSAELRKRPPGPFFIENRRACSHKGESFPVDIRGYIGPIGENIRYLVFFHDISQRIAAEEKRKSMENQVDEARRLEAIGALSAGISHEINTPIQFIGDNLEYLESALKNIHRAYHNYDSLKQAAAQAGVCHDEVDAIDQYNASINLNILITEINAALSESRDGIKQVRDIVLLMKEFAHPGTDGKDEIDVNAIIKNVIAICRNRRKHVADVELNLDPDLPRAPCRKGQLQQVVLNLVLNAIDAIDETKTGNSRGCIEIETRATESHIQIYLSDSGCGIPQSLRQKIFDPFFTTKPVGKGTGQGLALAKNCIVKGHGGKLSLVDKADYATTFLIELPRTGALAEAITEHDNDVAA